MTESASPPTAEIKFWLCLFLAVWLWGSDSTSLSLHLCISNTNNQNLSPSSLPLFPGWGCKGSYCPLWG